MNWYYHANILYHEIPKVLLDKPIEKKINARQQQTTAHPPAHPCQAQYSELLRRNEIKPAENYVATKELIKVKKELARQGLIPEVKEINTLIKKIKTEYHYKPKTEIFTKRREIKDKNNTLVGILYLAEIPEIEKDIFIGDYEFVLRPTFYFRRTASGRDYVLQTRAELTGEGLAEVIKYTKKILKKKFRRVNSKTLREVKQKSNAEINKILSRTDTQGLVINGINVHINLNGKMEVFAQLNRGLESYLEEDNFNGNNRIRLVKTNNEMNLLFADAFRALSIVISGITNN